MHRTPSKLAGWPRECGAVGQSGHIGPDYVRITYGTSYSAGSLQLAVMRAMLINESKRLQSLAA
jgi:hypothetical protein